MLVRMKTSDAKFCFGLILVVLLAITTTTEGDLCTLNFASQSDITNLFSVSGQERGLRAVGGAMGGKKKKEEDNDPRLREREKQQSLFAHQEFNCSGKLTGWKFAAKWEKDNNAQLPELQVWRPVDDSTTLYNKVLSVTVNTIARSINSVYTYDLSDSPFDIHRGDVLGVFQPEKKKSKIIVYLQDSEEDIHSYYYKDKTKVSLSQMDINGDGIKNRNEKPLVTAIIEQLQTTSSTMSHLPSPSSLPPSSSSPLPSSSPSITLPSPSSISTLTTITTTHTRSHTDIIYSSHSTSCSISATINESPTHLNTCRLTIDMPTTSFTDSTSTDKTLSPTTILENFKSTSTVSIETTNEEYVYNTNLATSTATPPSHATSQSCIDNNAAIGDKSDDILVSSCLLNGPDTLEHKDASDGVPMAVVIVLVIVFAVIFILGMTTVTVCALCVMGMFFKKKQKELELEMMPYPSNGSRPNRYLQQKSVSSPMYEATAHPPNTQIVPFTLQGEQPTDNAVTPGNSGVQTTASMSSVGSSCPSVTVQPNVMVNTRGSYDHLIIPQAGEKASSPVSPYELPVVPDETLPTRNIPIGFYDLADEIYVPTEEQRMKLSSVGKETEQESLYKSLYKAQHEIAESNDLSKHPGFFKETQEYWKPSYTKPAIYKQLANKRFREVPRHKIQVIEYLGSGQFATVNKAMWRMGGGDVEVAVKMIKEGAPEDEKIKFLQEAAINGQFHHLNIVRLLGVVTVGEPTMIILELLRNGNLKKYLISKRPKKGETVSSDLAALLLNFSKQVSSGMEYLSKKTFVHRDIAARNILVSDQLICKVADFGMSRDLEDNNYYVSQGGLIPIKWTAPEALYFRKYSSASDVWSYGVLLFEIWSLGKKPFSTITNEQYIEDIDEGKRLAPPPGCPRPMYQLMMDCWHPEPSDRPSFTALYQHLHTSPQNELLSLDITDNELAESPQCDALGGPLESGSRLFMDLQLKYS